MTNKDTGEYKLLKDGSDDQLIYHMSILMMKLNIYSKVKIKK